MKITTKTLAVHSIQANMVGTEQSDKVLNVMLASGKLLKIVAADKREARQIDNAIHFYPSQGGSNNSKDMDLPFTMEILELNDPSLGYFR